MLKIVENEGKHFTIGRTLQFLLTFIFIFVTMIVINSHLTNKESTNMIISGLTLIIFIAYCIVDTYYNAKHIHHIHEIKRSENYEFDDNDLHFD